MRFSIFSLLLLSCMILRPLGRALSVEESAPNSELPSQGGGQTRNEELSANGRPGLRYEHLIHEDIPYIVGSESIQNSNTLGMCGGPRVATHERHGGQSCGAEEDRAMLAKESLWKSRVSTSLTRSVSPVERGSFCFPLLPNGGLFFVKKTGDLLQEKRRHEREVQRLGKHTDIKTRNEQQKSERTSYTGERTKGGDSGDSCDEECGRINGEHITNSHNRRIIDIARWIVESVYKPKTPSQDHDSDNLASSIFGELSAYKAKQIEHGLHRALYLRSYRQEELRELINVRRKRPKQSSRLFSTPPADSQESDSSSDNGNIQATGMSQQRNGTTDASIGDEDTATKSDWSHKRNKEHDGFVGIRLLRNCDSSLSLSTENREKEIEVIEVGENLLDVTDESVVHHILGRQGVDYLEMAAETIFEDGSEHRTLFGDVLTGHDLSPICRIRKVLWNVASALSPIGVVVITFPSVNIHIEETTPSSSNSSSAENHLTHFFPYFERVTSVLRALDGFGLSSNFAILRAKSKDVRFGANDYSASAQTATNSARLAIRVTAMKIEALRPHVCSSRKQEEAMKEKKKENHKVSSNHMCHENNVTNVEENLRPRREEQEPDTRRLAWDNGERKKQATIVNVQSESDYSSGIQEERRELLHNSELRSRKDMDTKPLQTSAMPIGTDFSDALSLGRTAWGVEKVFVINLDRRKERWEEFVHMATSRGMLVRDKDRFRAVDGGSLAYSKSLLNLFPLSPPMPPQPISSFAAASSLPPSYSRFNIPIVEGASVDLGPNPWDDHGYRKGVLGCALSHLKIWDMIASHCLPGGATSHNTARSTSRFNRRAERSCSSSPSFSLSHPSSFSSFFSSSSAPSSRPLRSSSRCSSDAAPSSISSFLVLEDDVILSDSFANDWKNIYSMLSLDPRWDLVLLGTTDRTALYPTEPLFPPYVYRMVNTRLKEPERCCFDRNTHRDFAFGNVGYRGDLENDAGDPRDVRTTSEHILGAKRGSMVEVGDENAESAGLFEPVHAVFSEKMTDPTCTEKKNTKECNWTTKCNASDYYVVKRRRSRGGGSFGYLIRSRAASRLLQLAREEGVTHPIDWFLFEKLHLFEVYEVVPALVSSSASGARKSDTIESYSSSVGLQSHLHSLCVTHRAGEQSLSGHEIDGEGNDCDTTLEDGREEQESRTRCHVEKRTIGVAVNGHAKAEDEEVVFVEGDEQEGGGGESTEEEEEMEHGIEKDKDLEEKSEAVDTESNSKSDDECVRSGDMRSEYSQNLGTRAASMATRLSGVFEHRTGMKSEHTNMLRDECVLKQLLDDHIQLRVSNGENEVWANNVAALDFNIHYDWPSEDLTFNDCDRIRTPCKVADDGSKRRQNHESHSDNLNIEVEGNKRQLGHSRKKKSAVIPPESEKDNFAVRDRESDRRAAGTAISRASEPSTEPEPSFSYPSPYKDSVSSINGAYFREHFSSLTEDLLRARLACADVCWEITPQFESEHKHDGSVNGSYEHREVFRKTDAVTFGTEDFPNTAGAEEEDAAGHGLQDLHDQRELAQAGEYKGHEGEGEIQSTPKKRQTQKLEPKAHLEMRKQIGDFQENGKIKEPGGHHPQLNKRSKNCRASSTAVEADDGCAMPDSDRLRGCTALFNPILPLPHLPLGRYNLLLYVRREGAVVSSSRTQIKLNVAEYGSFDFTLIAGNKRLKGKEWSPPTDLGSEANFCSFTNSKCRTIYMSEICSELSEFRVAAKHNCMGESFAPELQRSYEATGSSEKLSMSPPPPSFSNSSTSSGTTGSLLNSSSLDLGQLDTDHSDNHNYTSSNSNINGDSKLNGREELKPVVPMETANQTVKGLNRLELQSSLEVIFKPTDNQRFTRTFAQVTKICIELATLGNLDTSHNKTKTESSCESEKNPNFTQTPIGANSAKTRQELCQYLPLSIDGRYVLSFPLPQTVLCSGPSPRSAEETVEKLTIRAIRPLPVPRLDRRPGQALLKKVKDSDTGQRLDVPPRMEVESVETLSRIAGEKQFESSTPSSATHREDRGGSQCMMEQQERRDCHLHSADAQKQGRTKCEMGTRVVVRLIDLTGTLLQEETLIIHIP